VTKISAYAELDRFLAALPRAAMVNEIVSLTELNRDYVAQLLDLYANEVLVGYKTVAPYLSCEARILEVGAGLGLLSSFLTEQGYTVVSLEPVGMGFDFFSAGRKATEKCLISAPPQTLDISAEELNPDRHDAFDLIFSIHVLEHIERLDEAFAAMVGVLKPAGRMVHVCPNYSFPYDPHFGIPLLPFRPDLTAKILPAAIVDSPTWRSLNFINARCIRRLAHAHGLDAHFTKGQLASMIRRVQEDSHFAERHAGFASRLLAATRVLGVERVARILPSWLDSPMFVELRFQ
jgi:2-polyprenyl-3-methyl-5-hydroxy-6-metoxy-1,4-benzoquinol methylase